MGLITLFWDQALCDCLNLANDEKFDEKQYYLEKGFDEGSSVIRQEESIAARDF